jgi:dTDP-4-dehydrorhamnose 3,5-epimerase
MSIDGVVVTKLTRHEDERGHFAEIARTSSIPVAMAQASHSHSKADVLRGLHFHRAQTDLWYLATGRAQIALVDLRAKSDTPTVDTFILDATAPSTLLIPPGVAHGYLALTDIDMLYWTDKEWDPADEQGVAWNDPAFGIEWAISDPILSERDRTKPAFAWQDIHES